MHCKQNIFRCLSGNLFLLFTLKSIYSVKFREEMFDKSCNDYVL